MERGELHMECAYSMITRNDGTTQVSINENCWAGSGNDEMIPSIINQGAGMVPGSLIDVNESY